MTPRLRTLKRTLVLIAILRSTGGASLDRLAQELSVSTRTIRRDLEVLQDAGLPVFDFTNDDTGVRLWRMVKGASCHICGRSTIKGAELRRELAAITLDESLGANS